MSEIHTQVENIYQVHKNEFKILENIFYDEHLIPPEITRDTVKQRILGALNNDEMSSEWISSPKTLTYNLLLFIMAMGYFLWFALFGVRYRSVKVDLLFDYWSLSFDDFYDEILKEFPSLNIAAFGPNVNELHELSRIPFSKRFMRKFKPYSRRSAWSVFKSHYYRFGTYWLLSKHTNINFVDLALRLSAEIAGAITSIEGISSKILVSANDNGYSPYRYHLYRSNGIGRIFLIQNGGKLELDKFYNSFIYCDFYLGWSQKRLDHSVQMHCNNKIPIGSIKLSNFLHGYDAKKTTVKYDIVFVEQYVDHPNPKSAFYLNLLQYLVRYALENPNIRVAFCRRPGIFEHISLCKQVNAILRDSQIIILETKNILSSYEYILNSKIIVSLDSSLRFEAIMLDKPVINCINRPEPYDFLIKYSDPCFIISTDEYSIFSKKINFMLENLDNPSIIASFKKLQAETVDKVDENASFLAANLIKAEFYRMQAFSSNN
jgi:surface carbohydrate biosynthesis protein